MKLLFVGDGPRDCATVPHLVSGILSSPVEPQRRAWKQIELFRGTGYGRKLLFTMAEARTLELEGVVATVDRDAASANERLSELKDAREHDRSKPIMPL